MVQWRYVEVQSGTVEVQSGTVEVQSRCSSRYSRSAAKCNEVSTCIGPMRHMRAVQCVYKAALILQCKVHHYMGG